MAITVVQSKTASDQVAAVQVTLDSPPTAGNLLVYWHSARSLKTPGAPAGWTQHPSGTVDGNNDRASMFYKVSDGTETSIQTVLPSPDRNIVTVVEISGATQLDTSAETTGSSASITTGSVTPTASNVIILGGAVINTSDTNRSMTPDSGWTELADSMVDQGVEGGFHPLHWLVYRIETSASGSYNPSGTCTQSSPFGGQTIVFSEAPAPGVWIDWDDDGFDTTTTLSSDAPLARMMPEAAFAALSDNVTSRVVRFDWHRGGSYDHVGSDGPGGATIILRNDDGRFDPDNTASPLYGKLVPGLPVWIGAIKTTGALSGSGTVRGVFGGYVREFNPTVRDKARFCEVICEDVLGRWAYVPVTVSPSLTRDHGEMRTAILDAVGEASGRRSLETEPDSLPISAADSENTLSLLDELNTATASRHFVAPGDSSGAWYTYTVVNKYHKLAAAADEAIDGDDITDISGWRVTRDNVIEAQRASVNPVRLTANNAAVWVGETPLTVTNVTRREIWATFDDYVFDATLDTNVTSGTISTTLTNFGKTAKIEIWATSASAVIGKLQILGRQVVRLDTVQVIAGDDSAGARAGSVVSSEFLGSVGGAQTICNFRVWKFGLPLKRPSLTMAGKSTTTLATIFERDIYDVVTLTVDTLSVTTRRMEIIGLRGTCVPGRAGNSHWTVNYELQEAPSQSAISWFTVGTDTVGSSVPIAPF